MSKSYSINPAHIQKGALKPLLEHVLVTDMVFDERLSVGGIVLLNDDGRGHGIRPRWGRVYAVGPDQQDVKVGQWILVDHGRWTRGMDLVEHDGDTEVKVTLRRVDPKDILLISDEDPTEYSEGIGSAVDVEKKEFHREL